MSRPAPLSSGHCQGGFVADKSQALLLESLQEAAKHPEGMPLFAGRTASGIFRTGVAGKKAAQLCQEQGYLDAVDGGSNGKPSQGHWALSEKGLAYLLSQVNPREVLARLVAALEERQIQLDLVLACVRQAHNGLSVLKANAETVLRELGRPAPVARPEPLNGVFGQSHALRRLRACHSDAANGHDSERWLSTVQEHLTERLHADALEDCPLPELFQTARRCAPELTVGRFHDGLRRLHEEGRVYLHPWTGPLYEIPEPALALLVGHEIAFYASSRP
jgi:hypothetical protein